MYINPIPNPQIRSLAGAVDSVGPRSETGDGRRAGGGPGGPRSDTAAPTISCKSGDCALTRHIDGEGGSTVGWEFNLGNGRLVWAGELSRQAFSELEPEQQTAMHDDYGWFIVLYKRTESKVLGKAVDEDAAMALAEMIGMSLLAESAAE